MTDRTPDPGGFATDARGFADAGRQGARGGWWYLASLGAILGGGVVFLLLLAVVGEMAFPQSLWIAGEGVDRWETTSLADAMGGFTLLILSIAIFAGLVLFCAAPIHGRRMLSYISAGDRFGWRDFFISLGATGLLGALGIAVWLLFWPEEAELVFNAERFWTFLPLVLILLPFQVAGEEILFRGYLLQAVGHATRSFWLRLLVPAVLFAAIHLFNPEVEVGGYWAVASYGAVSLYLGWLTLRCNGLEMPLGLHLGNNIIAIGLVSVEGIRELAPTIVRVKDPNFAVEFASAVVFFALHWLIVRRFIRHTHEARL